MLNYWWVTRPKRKLNSIPDVLAVFAESAMKCEWFGQREAHLSLESALEKSGLKREGDRRDQTGGGGRTYKAWLVSLGLIFIQNTTKKLQLTLAGEAILNGESPVRILTNQILKYQFPSAFSLEHNVNVSERFKIRPFRFLLKLLSDDRIRYLTQDEIAKIVITEAETESDRCYEKIVARVLEFRNFGDDCLEKDFAQKYTSSKGNVNFNNPYAHLQDIANTIFNWLEYTQLVVREEKQLRVLPDRAEEVENIVKARMPFIPRPEEHEYFQRRYGLDTIHLKDTRNLLQTPSITNFMIAEIQIKKFFISAALKEPIGGITSQLIEKISEQSGISPAVVVEVLQKNFPHGAIGAFMANYFEMAFAGRKKCREFEEATANIFREVFNFESHWLGSASSGKEVPDILLLSNESGFQAIIDTKAYARYDLPAIHRDRMIYHYLPDIKNYGSSELPTGFFSYIAGGFSRTVVTPLNEIIKTSSVNGSAMPVSVFINMAEKHSECRYTHYDIKKIFSINRQIGISDLSL